MLPRLNPVPRFPPYSGGLQVGSSEFEIPVTELPSSSVPPDPTVTTIKFRVFYPAQESGESQKPVWWLPEPQKEWVGAYCRFLGVPNWLSEAFSYVPTLLHHIRIPASSDAPLRSLDGQRPRWPVMVFSHGLGGSFNGYSYIAGSLASYGMVVFVPEHRDGSAPVSIIRSADGSSTSIPYQFLSHTPSPEVLDARNQQLRVRLWELGLLHQAILNLDEGKEMTNLATKDSSATQPVSSSFKSGLDVQEAGRITWAGHSFGAATVVQFVKSVFWRADPISQEQTPAPHRDEYQPLYEPDADSKLVSQITPDSPIVLLDLWTMPLWGEKTRWLWNKPLPCYAYGGSGGSNVLAVMSEEFFKWTTLINRVKRILSRDPAKESGSSATDEKRQGTGSRLFYVLKSAHLSQSDFGLLFPWLMQKWLGAEEPERTMKLNIRAILQMLRDGGIPVEAPTPIDREESDAEDEDGFVQVETEDPSISKAAEQDSKILADDGKIRGWISIRLDDEPPSEPSPRI